MKRIIKRPGLRMFASAAAGAAGWLGMALGFSAAGGYWPVGDLLLASAMAAGTAAGVLACYAGLDYEPPLRR